MYYLELNAVKLENQATSVLPSSAIWNTRACLRSKSVCSFHKQPTVQLLDTFSQVFFMRKDNSIRENQRSRRDALLHNECLPGNGRAITGPQRRLQLQQHCSNAAAVAVMQ